MLTVVTFLVRNLLLLSFVVLLVPSLSYAQPSATHGMVDVRQHLEQETAIPLSGEWEFFWATLLSPGDSITLPTAIANFPMPWTSQQNEQNEYYPSFGFASYRLRVILDPTQEYALATPAQYNAFRVFVNGELVSQNGVVGDSKESHISFYHNTTAVLEKAWIQDTTEIVVQVSNFDHVRGGPVDQLVLGKKSVLVRKQGLLTSFDLFLTGALIMGGLFFLGLYMFGRHQRSILYFALFCLCFSYYIIGSGNYVLHGLFPNYPWKVAFHIEYTAIYVSTLLLVLFTRSLYPKDTPRFLVPTTWTLVTLFIILILILPTHVFPALHEYYLMVMALIMILGIGVYIRAAYYRRTGSFYSLIGISLLLFVFALRLINFLSPFPIPLFVVPLGYMLFFFLYSLTLSQQFAQAWKLSRDQAQASLQARSEFLSVMSHEIRTPMNAVIGLTNHLLADNPQEKQLEVLNQLKFSGENLLILINDILDFSKIEAKKVEFDQQSVDLRNLFENLILVYDALAKEKEIGLSFEVDEALPANLLCDPTRMGQVLTNLIGNAIKFTQKGQVTLHAALISKTDSTCKIEFSVVDTGIGISAEKLDTIFESFSQANTSITREYGGTGLGLAISKRILDLQGAELKVRSEVGKGSCFYFIQELPIAQKLTKNDEANGQTFAPLSGYVLLVEDNEVNIMVARKFLERWGLDITEARNGQQAIEILQEKSFNLVLMDLQMPIMDGFSATIEIRKSNTVLPIIALTATALPDEQARMLEVGMNSFVLKPFKPETLYEKIVEYLK